jgi:hypothetical protein
MENKTIRLSRCLLMDLLELPVYNLVHDHPAENLKYHVANISKKTGGLSTIRDRLSQAQKNRLEVLNDISLDSQWKILMNTWRLFGSVILDEERKAHEQNQQIVVYQSKPNLGNKWKFLKMSEPDEIIPLLFWLGRSYNPGLERLQATRKHEQRASEALHQETNYEYYKNIIQPNSWKDQPLKFDHTMNNGNEMMYIPVRTVYPLSLQNGYELLCLWKYEHLKFLYEDLFLLEEDHSYESLKVFVQNIKARMDFLKSQFEYAHLFSRLRPYEMTPNDFFDCDWTERTKFREIMQSNTCTEWRKMDVKGDSYTGYWISEDPAIKDKAWDLTWEDNFNHIYGHLDKKKYYGLSSPLSDMNIYYPLTMMYVIEYLCASRCEAPVEVIDFYEFFINHVVVPNYEVLMAEDKPLHFID